MLALVIHTYIESGGSLTAKDDEKQERCFSSHDSNSSTTKRTYLALSKSR